MNCPKCNGKMMSNCCIKCGYLESGHKVSLKYNKDENEDIKIYEEKYDTLLHNDNWYVPFIMGPLYLSYKGNLLLGSFLTYLDIAIRCLLFSIPSFLPNELLIIPFFSQLGFYSYIIYVIISKMIYAAVLNHIVLKMDYMKINRLKEKYKNNYKDKLYKNKNHPLYVLITILTLILFLFIIISV